MREDIQIHQVDCSEFICAICFQVFYKPMKTLCGHNFCGKCISSWMQIQKSCPCCRKEFHNYNFYNKDEIMSQKVEELEVTCLRCDNWNGQLIDLKNHRSYKCNSLKLQIQLHETLIIQDNPEDLIQKIINEVLSIKKQQNYIQLLDFENEFLEEQEIHPNEQRLKKKRKIQINNNQGENEDCDVQVLQDEEINTLKNSQNYKIKQINKRYKLQNKFLKMLMDSQYRIETKQFFASLIQNQNFVVFNNLNQQF